MTAGGLMARGKREKPSDNRDTATPDAPPTESEIRSVMADVVPDLLGSEGDGPLFPGWFWLAGTDFRRESRWTMSDDHAGRLVARARGLETTPEWTWPPDPYAFDAACHVGALMLREGTEPPPTLRIFLAEVLNGKIKRPRRRGRQRHAQIRDIYQFALAKALLRLGWVAQEGENTATAKATARPKAMSAARVVADAFSAMGRTMSTNPARVKDLCANDNYALLRQSVEASGMVDNTAACLRVGLRNMRNRAQPATE